MNIADEYQKKAMRTAASGADWGNVGLGLAGECGEVADSLKKMIYQGHTLEEKHLKEELGDICWYIALACNIGGFSFSDVLNENIYKLEKRYPDGFDANRSINRK